MKAIMRSVAYVAVVIPFAIVACAKAEVSPDSTSDAGFVGRDEENPDPVDPTPVDPTPTTDSGTDPDTGSGACTGKIVVNEVLPATSAANEEFVELYNPSSCEVGIEGFKLMYKSVNNGPTGGSPLHTFAAGAAIKGKAFLVIGTTQYKGKKDLTFNGGGVTVNGGMGAEGQVALFDGSSQKMDAVAFGGVTAGDYTEKSPTVKTTANASVSRKVDGVDTDDNSKDFHLTDPTPGAANGP